MTAIPHLLCTAKQEILISNIEILNKFKIRIVKIQNANRRDLFETFEFGTLDIV